MGITVYWKYQNYINDIQDNFTFHFNSNQKRLHSECNIGDNIYLISGIRTNKFFNIYLLGKLIVKAKTLNTPGYKYGKYRVWGDNKNSVYYDAVDYPLTPLLNKFDSIKSYPTNEAHKYAQAFQTIRVLSEHDIEIINNFSQNLPIHSKTYYEFPEQEYEEQIKNNNEISKIIDTQDLSTKTKKKYLKKVTRNKNLVKELNNIYNGKCQLCSFDPITFYGKPLCAAHHIIYISCGGDDELENLILLCPNCHEAVHKTSATFDYKNLDYKFENGRIQPLVINKHLKKASG